MHAKRTTRHTQTQTQLSTHTCMQTLHSSSSRRVFFAQSDERKQNGFFLQSEHKIWKSSTSVTYLKYFPSGSERVSEQQRRWLDGDGVGMHSFTKFFALSIARFHAMPLFHLSAAVAAGAVSRLHYYYQFNTYNTLIPAAVAVTESNRVTATAARI